MKRFILALVLGALSNSAFAVPVLLDSMLITVDNQESTIGLTFQGGQNFNGSLTIPVNVAVDYFLVEITDVQVSPSAPLFTRLEYLDLSVPSSVGSPYVASMEFFKGGELVAIGDTLIADGIAHNLPGAGTSSAGMYDIFSSFVNGPGIQSPLTGFNSTGWSSAVNSPYIGLEFTVGAYGEAVPLPGAVWLFGSALVALGWMRRKH